MISKYIREILVRAPVGWERILLYREVVLDGEDVIPVETFEVWSNGAASYEFSPTALAEKYACEYYETCAQYGNRWVAMRLEILVSGKYNTHFFYEGTPMSDGDYDQMYARISSPFES